MNKEVLAVDCWELSRVEGGWSSPRFSIAFNDWELEEVQDFLSVIQAKRVVIHEEDLLLVRESQDGRFSVKLFYLNMGQVPGTIFPYHFVWNPWVPTKVSFFAWEASWGKILTQDQLKRRGRALANRCFMCGEGEEMVDHLLIHCPSVRGFWELLLAIVGFS